MVNIMNWPFYCLCWFYLVPVLIFVRVMTVSTYMYIYIQSYTVCVCIYIQYICVYIYIYWFTQAATHPAIRSLAFESLVQAPCGSTWKSELSDSMEMPKIPRWETCILRLVMARAVIAVVFFFFICFGRMFWQEVKTWKKHKVCWSFW